MVRWVSVTDMGFGDAGKGTITDFLCAEAHRIGHKNITVARHNGGPQCAHNVVVGGRHHTFAQFGSGTFVPGVRTFLGGEMMLNPHNLMNEYDHLYSLGEGDVLDRTFIDGRLRIIMPWHMWLNRMLEDSRKGNRHGSCGQGIGVLKAQDIDAPYSILHAKDLDNPDRIDYCATNAKARFEAFADDHPEVATKYIEYDSRLTIKDLIEFYRSFKSRMNIVSDPGLLAESSLVIAEGAQGVLLDQNFKEADPYLTWSDTTGSTALLMAMEAGGDEDFRHIGVSRPYMVRHGPGPLPTEDPDLKFPEPHNTTNHWQGRVRFGHLDMHLLRHAYREMVPPPTDFAITCMDHIRDTVKMRSLDVEVIASIVPVRHHTEYAEVDSVRFPDAFAKAFSGLSKYWASVAITSWGPDRTHKKDMRFRADHLV